MRNILGRHGLRAVAAAATMLTLASTASAGTTPNAGTPHDHASHTASASAEPDHTATLNRANPKFTWESSGSGSTNPPLTDSMFRCTGSPFRCDYVLLHVETAGELRLTLDGDGVVNDPTGEVCGTWSGCMEDIDGYLYRSNSAGEPAGNTLTWKCATLSSRETCELSVWPGFYVVEVEYYEALEVHYIGTVELDAAAPAPPAAEPQMIPLEDCKFTLYWFKDSAERLQAIVPPGYRFPRHPSTLGPIEGSATIAASAYDCDRIEIPGSAPASGTFTVLSVRIEQPVDTPEFPELPEESDFYVLWIHANNPQLVELLASRGMPAYLVPGMTFEKPLQSLALRVEVPWSTGPYELETTGIDQGIFHSHDNTYWHDAGNGPNCLGDGAGPGRPGCVVRMDFQTQGVRDQACLFDSDDHHTGLECGSLTAQAGTPVARFFGGSDRTADFAWDHDPIERSWLVLE